MKSRNLNYCYYVEYFENVPLQNPKSDDCNKILKEKNQQLTQYRAEEPALIEKLPDNVAPNCIELQTTYPGLLIGTGIAHGFGGKGEASLGLCLDYVTGTPYIPGSSVKGTLRSAFSYPDYIRELLHDAGVNDEDVPDINELKARIFGNPLEEKKYQINTAEQDIFFDAIVVSKGELLSTDAITPHRQNPELLELAAPNPLTIIRIRPGVTFRFQFNLHETLGISPEQKKEIFKTILTDLGIGAKTNVGYGVLKEPKNNAASTANVTISPLEGVCEVCGKPTGFNSKTGKFYPLCRNCQFKKKS